MEIVTVIYGLAVGIIAFVGLWKAYKNDNKISSEEIQEVIALIRELLDSKDDKKSQ